jgi:hypothetical protein
VCFLSSLAIDIYIYIIVYIYISHPDPAIATCQELFHPLPVGFLSGRLNAHNEACLVLGGKETLQGDSHGYHVENPLMNLISNVYWILR